MAVSPQKQAAKKFREYWTFNRPGSEIRGCQQYWNMLLGEVLGMTVKMEAVRLDWELSRVQRELSLRRHRQPMDHLVNLGGWRRMENFDWRRTRMCRCCCCQKGAYLISLSD